MNRIRIPYILNSVENFEFQDVFKRNYIILYAEKQYKIRVLFTKPIRFQIFLVLMMNILARSFDYSYDPPS